MARHGFGLLLSLLPSWLLAQQFTPNPDWRFENFNSQNHFISREISNLVIDKHGYVWASSAGVQRFDGYKTIEFNSFDQAKGALKANYADVTTDSSGRVWISSAGLCYYDDASGKFIYVQADPKHNITYVQAFLVQNNYLWFICDYGLARLDLRSLKISFTSLCKVTDALGVFLTDENTLFVSSREKVYSYNIPTDTYSSTTLIYNHGLLKVFTMAKNDKGTFLGTNHGLFTLKNAFEVVPENSEIGDIDLNDMLFLPADKRKKYLFLATEGEGILVYNTATKKIEYRYVADETNPFSLPNNIMGRLYADKNGRLWISTAQGISMLDINNQQWKTRFLNKSNTDDLNINKIAKDKFDASKVWMSSYSQGMICMDWRTKRIEKKFSGDPAIQRVYDFTQISKSKWLLATPKKIIEWDSQSGILLQKELPVPDSLTLRYSISRLIMADNHTCFITTNRGLFKYDLIEHQIKPVSVYNKADRKANPLQYILLNGFYDKGIVWAASRNGLFSYNVSSNSTTIYRGTGENSDYFLFDICKAVNDQVICAAGDGIAIFNMQTNKFNVIHTLANLFKPDCASVISINNMVWISTEAGILNYDLATGRSARAEHETPLMQIFPGSPFTIINNEIVVGFRNGYAYFTPDLKNALMPSNPVIESVYVNNQPVLQQHANKTSSESFVFDHSSNSINIAFTAFLYTDPNYINFRYRLKGAEPKWQYTQDQRSANYAQLAPGNYTFYVQSGNKNGNWNEQLASVNFIIQPPYWETWWFRTLVILAIAFGLYRLYRYRINHILAIERIREKIASDFHDDIGSALSSISIFSEVADKQLKQNLPAEQTREIIGHISFHSRAMLDAMDDIVWAVNPQNDHFDDLAVRMREFAIPLLEARNIHFDIDIEEAILKTRIKMDVRKNIFLIFKECINNILKHSGCSTMKVSINKLNSQLEMVITDNGKGFDVNGKNTRNGLKNMQKRAAEINGMIKVTSGRLSGTQTTLLVNII